MSLLIAVVVAALIQSPAPSGATLTGQVLEDGTGAAVAGAQVNVMRAPRERPAAGTMGVPVRPLSTTTDREGRFQVDGLEPGRYRISVQKVGFAMSLDAAPPIDLGAGERRGIDVRLQRGAVIVGRVLDEAGEPLAEARVMAMRKMPASSTGATARPDLLRPAGPSAQSNDLGEFRLFGLPAGEYYVQVSPRPDVGPGAASIPRARTLVPTFFPSTSDQAGAEPIALGAGQTSESLVITMVGAPAFHVAGVVVDEAGKPVPNALVRLSQEDARGQPVFTMQPWNQVHTDQAGRFSLGNVTPGSYTLLAIAPELFAAAPGRAGSGSSASAFTWSGISGGISGGVSGSVGGGITTETSNGVTVQYRDDQGTRVAVTVGQAHVTNFQVTVRAPARQD
jgi:protocatechuate 3,4-dioxygenase beta subunit